MKNVSINKNGQKDISAPLPEAGIVEWFHINDHDHVIKAAGEMKKLGVRHLRTGISWADYHTNDGRKWYDWLIPFLSSSFTLLPCFLYTPPSLGIVAKSSSPPKNTKDYADFIDLFINRHGKHFEYVELWNEPNNRSEYDYMLDQSWDMFAGMIRKSSYWAKHLGKKTVLGGMSPIDLNWLRTMAKKGVLEFIDVIGIHGFPGVFEYYWEGWDKSVSGLNNLLQELGLSKEIWITETGYSTWRHDESEQIEKFAEVMKVPVKRIYWYGLTDLPRHLPTVDGHLSDEREYHFGMITEDGIEKLLFRLWEDGGPENIIRNKWMTSSREKVTQKKQERVLITGGGGFIGTNVAHRLLNEGYHVTVFDNLSRPGAEMNLSWLKLQHPQRLDILVADVRDKHSVEKAVKEVSHIFHFAAQVAVTSSLINPLHDYSVNLQGTVNILEAVRKSPGKPSLLYTSTNKVYGNLNDLDIRKNTTRYFPQDKEIEASGISEQQNLDFHSPYGNSKGSADQYILDYTRSFGLRNVVFRMSCIYGPHQMGTEDQGWVAHFIIKVLRNEQITLFGDGMQVRDILFVDDLVDAFLLAWKNIDILKGQAFNIGGGPANSVSLIELIKFLDSLHENPASVKFRNWRTGDQKYYVSDTSKFRAATDWIPKISYNRGVELLYDWLRENSPLQTRKSFNSVKNII